MGSDTLPGLSYNWEWLCLLCPRARQGLYMQTDPIIWILNWSLRNSLTQEMRGSLLKSFDASGEFSALGTICLSVSLPACIFTNGQLGWNLGSIPLVWAFSPTGNFKRDWILDCTLGSWKICMKCLEKIFLTWIDKKEMWIIRGERCQVFKANDC